MNTHKPKPTTAELTECPFVPDEDQHMKQHLPYILNSPIQDYQDTNQLQLITEERGIALYMVQALPITHILGIPIRSIALFADEETLTGIYIRLDTQSQDIEQVRDIIHKQLNLMPITYHDTEDTSSVGYKWKIDNNVLSIKQEEGFIALRYSLKIYHPR